MRGSGTVARFWWPGKRRHSAAPEPLAPRRQPFTACRIPPEWCEYQRVKHHGSREGQKSSVGTTIPLPQCGTKSESAVVTFVRHRLSPAAPR